MCFINALAKVRADVSDISAIMTNPVKSHIATSKYLKPYALGDSPGDQMSIWRIKKGEDTGHE
jgi:hypothetical protein